MRHSQRNNGSLRIGLALVALLWFVSPGPVWGAELVLEDFSGRVKFAPLWPGGISEIGSDESLQWLKVTTDGTSEKVGNTFVANVRPYRPALDLSGKFVRVWLKVDDLKRLGGLELRMSSDRFTNHYFAFSFPRYDDLDANVVREGVWTALTLPFGSAEVKGSPDRTSIDSIGLYVSDAGQGPVQAWWGGLSAIDEPSEGVVSFTFDDGYDDHLMAAELMQKFGFRGTAYVIPNAVGEHGYMTLHQLVDLEERYHWEVAAHHETPFTDYGAEGLEGTMLGVQRFLIDNGFERGARHLAYPLGRQDPKVVRSLTRKHFTTARVAGGDIETLPPADPHLLRVFNVTKDTTPAEVGAAARRARDNKEWLILMFHYLVDKPEQDTEYAIDDFRKLLDEVKASKARVEPLIDVWDACGMTSSSCQIRPTPAAPAR